MLLTKAASQKNPFADYALGKLYSDGVLLAREMDKAFFHLHRSADSGNVYAQYRLGKWYLTEEYKDISKAVFYLTKAAAQNSDMAAYQLGKLYLSGEGIPKNVEQAVFYLELSAHAGNQYAQYLLGKAYLTGTDVERDKEKAYEYLLGTHRFNMVYRIIFSLVIFVGSVATLDLVWNLSDIANALMAIPNLICMLILSGEIAKDIKEFQKTLKK